MKYIVKYCNTECSDDYDLEGFMLYDQEYLDEVLGIINYDPNVLITFEGEEIPVGVVLDLYYSLELLPETCVESLLCIFKHGRFGYFPEIESLAPQGVDLKKILRERHPLSGR